MTKEDRNLLIQDLCTRLPYGVKIALKNSEAYHHDNVAKKGDVTIDRLKGFNGSYFSIYHDDPLDWSWYVSEINIEDIKPYLFPLSSMTEEQFLELTELCNMYDNYHDYNPYEYWGIQVCRKHIHENKPCFSNNYKAINWLNKNHFDYRGLIPKGLAIDCTDLNIYKEELK